MANPYVRQARNVFTGTAGATDLNAGDLVYFDGTDWERADADDATKYAEAMVVNTIESGELAILCTGGILVDADAPYTQGGQVYLSAPGGTPAAHNHTQTRPTGAVALKQVVGNALSTSEVLVDIKSVSELVVNLDSRGATSAQVEMDSGNFGGPTLDADNESAFFSCMVPENAVGVEIAYMWSAADATCGTVTVGVLVGSAISGAQHDAVTADNTITSTAAEGTAIHEMLRTDITTAFDATNILRPGALLGVHVFAEDAGTDIRWVFGVQIVFQVV